jgi:hypothetical protein
VIDTLSEVNGPGTAAVPFNTYDWRIRQPQIKDTFAAWFRIFRTVDAVKIPNYNPFAAANLCYSYLALQNRLTKIPNHQQEFQTNALRCERNKFQFLLSRMDADAQIGLHNFLARLSDSEYEGSDFAYEVGTSDLTGERSTQMWSIYSTRNQTDWKPIAAVAKEEPSAATPVLDEETPSKSVDDRLRDWLQGSNPRLVGWAAYYATRDKRRKLVPAMLAYVHTHAFDPAFQMSGAEFADRVAPQVRDAVDPMLAVVDALIQLRAVIPTGDLLQIAPVLSTDVLVAAIVPKPREELLYTVYLNGGLRSGEWQLYPRTAIDTGSGTLRWVTAGNILANAAYLSFVRDLLRDFSLVLRFSVVPAGGIITGNLAILPGCSVLNQNAQNQRDQSWPPVGTYILSAVAPSAKYNFGSLPVRISQEVTEIDGAPPIFIERRTDRLYEGTSECGFPGYSKSSMEATWLEELGFGKFPTTNWGGAQIMARLPDNPKWSEDLSFFSFTRLFEVKDNNDYHMELKQWLTANSTVYQNIMNGLRARRLVEESEPRKVLQIEIHGLDLRPPTGSNNSRSITSPPFPDLTPAGAEISWK